MDGGIGGVASDSRALGGLLAPDVLTSAESAFEGDVIRNVWVEGRLWFVSSDVCKALDLLNPRGTISKLSPREKGKVRLQTDGGEQEVNVITESGLYLLAFTSRKAGAEAFRLWVTDEVLPSLRRGAAGEAQATSAGDAYIRVPGPGQFRVALDLNGHVSIVPDESRIDQFYLLELEALAHASCLVGKLWGKFQLLEEVAARTGEGSNTRFQLGHAISQIQHIAVSAMRTRMEMPGGSGTPKA